MKQNRIYIISFFEGAAVMATELCGSKLISPYFGSSLYVWASVIAVTLGSLAAGYFYGGRLSSKENKTWILAAILAISAFYMGFMPLITNFFAIVAIKLPLIPAVIVSSSLLLIVPMFLMGAASPIVIAIQTHVAGDSGKVSGLVYSISTLGGIISTFLCGFFLIPSFGLYISLIIFAVLLLLSLFLLVGRKKYGNILFVLVLIIAFGFKTKTSFKNCIYETDGIMGKLNVIDDSLEDKRIIRKLLINNVVQTELDLTVKKSVSQYVGLLDSNITSVSSGKSLVLGLGGGVVSNLLVEKGYNVTAVELDERIIAVAKKYFSLDKSVKAIGDDARHFINVCSEKYDLMVLDLFKAEEQPGHVITMESLDKIKTMLRPNGFLVIVWHGYVEGERGLGTSILLNTLKQKEFDYTISTNTDYEDARNLLIFASTDQLPTMKSRHYEVNISETTEVNTDLRPVLEKYNVLANQAWRRNYIRYYYPTWVSQIL